MLKSRRVADCAALAFLAALIVASFADVFFAGRCFFVRDLTRYYFPTKSMIHRIVSERALPLWNPYYSGGQPALANPEYEVFYPGQWLIFLRDFYLGFRLHILLHFFIGAAGMFLLMRSLGTRVASALATSIAFVLGGPFLSATNLLTTLFPLAWFPWSIFFLRRYVRDRHRRDLAAAALFIAMIFLIFEPGCVVQIAAISAGYCLYHWRKGNPFWRTAVSAAAPFLLAGLLAAVQVLPTLEFIGHTSRSRGMAYDMVTTWSMPPARIAELLQPHLLGRNAFLSADYWGGWLYGAQAGPYFQSLYLGALMLVAVIAGCALRNRRIVIAVLSASAVLLVSFGDHTPIFRAAYAARFPLLLRFPERFAITAMFLLLIAGGLGIDGILSDDSWWLAARRIVIAGAVITALVTLFTASRAFSPLFGAAWHVPAFQMSRWLAFSRADWLATALRLALLSLLFIFARPRTFFASAALVCFTIIDLAPYVNELAPRMPRQYFAQPAVAAELKGANPQSRIFFLPEWSGGPIMRHYDADRSTIYPVIRNGMFPRLPAAWGHATVFERDIDLTNLVWSSDLLDAFLKKPQLNPAALDRYAAIANIEWLAVFRPPPRAVDATVRPVTFVRLHPSPRYYFADEVIRIHSTDEFASELASGRHRRGAAYVARDGLVSGVGSVTKVIETPNAINIDVDVRANALLVASVTRDAHWAATIDRLPVRVETANIAFQAIMVPPGRHHVELRYANRLVAAGGVFTALGLLLVAALAIPRHSKTSPHDML
ncbi:MAG TPA: hypothetical protein VGJ88_08225 [Thermoanaerobaculia bacterium]